MPDIVVVPIGGGGLSSGIIFGIEGARKKIQVIARSLCSEMTQRGHLNQGRS